MVFKKSVVVAAAALLVAAVFAAPADASPDTDFLGAMHSHGIQAHGGDDVLVDLGHEICMMRQDGNSEAAIIGALMPYAHNGLSGDDITFIVQQAEAAFCPAVGGVTV